MSLDNCFIPLRPHVYQGEINTDNQISQTDISFFYFCLVFQFSIITFFVLCRHLSVHGDPVTFCLYKSSPSCSPSIILWWLIYYLLKLLCKILQLEIHRIYHEPETTDYCKVLIFSATFPNILIIVCILNSC